MKRNVILIGALALALVLWMVPADIRIDAQGSVSTAPDIYEPDDTCGQAADGSGAEHTFHTSDDVDWVRFSDMPTGRVRYSITAYDNSDVNHAFSFEVYSDDCATLISRHIGNGIGFDSPTIADYRVKISPAGGWTGAYTVYGMYGFEIEQCVSGHVFRTGTQSGLANATIGLWLEDHWYPDQLGLVASQVTESDGRYEFWIWTIPGYGYRYFQIKEIDPPGCVSTSPNMIRFWDGNIVGNSKDFYDTPPFAFGLSPVNGLSCVGTRQDFVVSVTDSESADRITAVELLFDTGVWMRDAVRVRYDHATGLIYLRDADNTVWLGGRAPGTSHTITNSMARLRVGRCEVGTDDDGKELLLTVCLEFDSAFGGSYDQYVLAERDDGFYMGYDPFGQWTVDFCGSPTPTATPTPAVPQLGPGPHNLRQGANGYAGSQDVGISAWYPNENFDGGNNDVMTVRSGDQFVGLVHFNLDMVPPDAIIEEATLNLYAARFQDPAPPAGRTLTVGAFQVNRDWASGEATWMQAKQGQSWVEAGCNGVPQDRSGQAADTVIMEGVATWYAFDLTELVQEWVIQPSRNHGVALKAVAGAGIGIELVTSEHGGVTLRPELSIRFDVPTAPTNTFTPVPTETHTPTVTATDIPTSILTLTPTDTPTPSRVCLPLVVKQGW